MTNVVVMEIQLIDVIAMVNLAYVIILIKTSIYVKMLINLKLIYIKYNMDNLNSFIYRGIQKMKSQTSLNIFNILTNNNDVITICPNLYLGNLNAIKNTNILDENNIEAIVNCTKDIPFHIYFKDKSMFRLNIEDNKEFENLEKFKSKIIDATLFIDDQINQGKNVIVHCFWGLMRSPTVIASYLIYRYKMDVEGAIEFVKDKKNFSFHNLYNFKEILYFVKEHFDNEDNEKV